MNTEIYDRQIEDWLLRLDTCQSLEHGVAKAVLAEAVASDRMGDLREAMRADGWANLP